MLSTLSTLAPTLWYWVPEATVGLQFGAALLGFCLAADSAVQRLRQRMRHADNLSAQRTSGSGSTS